MENKVTKCQQSIHLCYLMCCKFSQEENWHLKWNEEKFASSKVIVRFMNAQWDLSWNKLPDVDELIAKIRLATELYS